MELILVLISYSPVKVHFYTGSVFEIYILSNVGHNLPSKSYCTLVFNYCLILSVVNISPSIQKYDQRSKGRDSFSCLLIIIIIISSEISGFLTNKIHLTSYNYCLLLYLCVFLPFVYKKNVVIF